MGPEFLMTSSESPKMPQKWPLFAWSTFVHQKLLPGFISQTIRSNSAPKDVSKKSGIWLSRNVCSKLWKQVENFISKAFLKKLCFPNELALKQLHIPDLYEIVVQKNVTIFFLWSYLQGNIGLEKCLNSIKHVSGLAKSWKVVWGISFLLISFL